MALHLFSPKGALHELTSSNLNALRRDDFLGTLQVAARMELAILLCRPLLERLDRLVSSPPITTRSAAVVMEKAKRAHRVGNDHEYQRLLAECNVILSLAHNHCVAEMLQSGRCPHCKGSEVRPRKGDKYPKCHGTGRVVPHADMVVHRFGQEMRQSVEQ